MIYECQMVNYICHIPAVIMSFAGRQMVALHCERKRKFVISLWEWKIKTKASVKNNGKKSSIFIIIPLFYGCYHAEMWSVNNSAYNETLNVFNVSFRVIKCSKKL